MLGGQAMKAVRSFGLTMLALAGFVFCGCSSEPPESSSDKAALHDDAYGSVGQMEEKDTSLRSFIQSSAGYVIFPSVGKGGLIIGGAYGKGEVYRAGQFIGYAELSQ